MRILLICSILLLSACNHNIPIQAIKDQPITAPSPAPLSVSSVEWKVFNSNGLKELAAKATDKTVIYTLDIENFTNFNKNLLELRRYILEQQEVINFYQRLQTNSIEEPKDK